MLSTGHMKRICRIFLSLLVSISIVSFSSYPTSAYTCLGGHLTGSANLLYYIDSSAYEYKESIMYGIQSWNGCSSKISAYRTYTKSYSRCDVYWGNYFPLNPDIIAQTYFFLNNVELSRVDLFSTDYYWCKIKFSSTNYKYYDGSSGLSYADRKATAAHEYGHVLGLFHSYTPENIMCQMAYERTAQKPSQDDINGVISIYGA